RLPPPHPPLFPYTTLFRSAAAFSVGQFSSNQIASTLTGAPMLESPARSLLLGDRILSYATQVSLNYAHSSRLSVHLGSFAAGGRSEEHTSELQSRSDLVCR